MGASCHPQVGPLYASLIATLDRRHYPVAHLNR
jgi:hypothetical protein